MNLHTYRTWTRSLRENFPAVAGAQLSVVLLFVTQACTQVTQPVPVADGGGPGVRNAHAMVFDSSRGVTLMFGGADASSVRADLWSWNGTEWRRELESGPSPRTFPAMVWDHARAEAVLVGGRRVLFGTDHDRDTVLADTWLLGASGWRRARVSDPPPRAEAGIAYDSARRVVVLFGGYNDVGGKTNRLGDTWEWDGSAWTLKSESGPAPRSGVAMAYDPRLQRVVLFGGNGGPRSDTWAWDGASWEAIATNDVPGQFNSLLLYDAFHAQLLRTTGWNGKERVGDTWIFAEPGWRLVSSAGPVPRNHSSAVFDARRGRIVLYGGHDGERVFGDVWERDGTRWHNRLALPPQFRIENGH